jgi:hypothetical protein
METVVELHEVSRLREEVFGLQILFHEFECNVLLAVWSEIIGICCDVGPINQANKLDAGEVLLASLRTTFTIDIGLSRIGAHLKTGHFGLDDISQQFIIDTIYK